jgi:protein-S-isoprenylcysteine O-methyltransferase Ste14
MLELIIFLLGSLGFVILSRQALTNPRNHGFPRFFAFEAILGLVVLNGNAWFAQPFSLGQLISWAQLLLSLALALHGFWLLRQLGKPDQTIRDTDRLSFEKTTRLVTVGAYRYIRHPLYASLLCFAWGAFLKHITLISGGLVILATVALYATAVLEEGENLRNFGDEYTAYMQRTKRFIPFLF